MDSLASRFAVTVEGGLTALGRAQRALVRWLEAAEVPPRPAYRAQLVFEEIATNVLKFARPDDPGRAAVEVEIELDAEALRMSFRDRGVPFDPTAAEPPPPATTLEAATVGGLGLGLVRKACSEIAYRREGETNRTEARIDLAG